jgi:hypothetical protein
VDYITDTCVRLPESRAPLAALALSSFIKRERSSVPGGPEDGFEPLRRIIADQQHD